MGGDARGELVGLVELEISKGRSPVVTIEYLQTSSGSTTEEYDVSYRCKGEIVKESLQPDYGDGDSIMDIAMSNLKFYLREYEIEKINERKVRIHKKTLEQNLCEAPDGEGDIEEDIAYYLEHQSLFSSPRDPEKFDRGRIGWLKRN